MLNDQLSEEALHRPHGGNLPQRKRSEINIFNCYLNTVHFFCSSRTSWNLFNSRTVEKRSDGKNAER